MASSRRGRSPGSRADGFQRRAGSDLPLDADGNEATPSTPYRWVDDDAAFDELVGELVSSAEYGIDTEFHRERTYFAQLALLQIAWPGGLALVDPLAVDIAPLERVLTGPGLAIVHAADQDLEVLDRACGAVPSRMFDTQLAAGFLGQVSPSLVNLVERLLGVRLRRATS